MNKVYSYGYNRDSFWVCDENNIADSIDIDNIGVLLLARFIRLKLDSTIPLVESRLDFTDNKKINYVKNVKYDDEVIFLCECSDYMIWNFYPREGVWICEIVFDVGAKNAFLFIEPGSLDCIGGYSKYFEYKTDGKLANLLLRIPDIIKEG